MDEENKLNFIHSSYVTRDGITEIHIIRLFLYVNEEALTDILTEQRILISCPWKTNDATEAVPAHQESRPAEVNEMGYVCLSAICDSPSMWGHYANRAKGACLVFDFNIYPYHAGQYEILKHGMSRSIPQWIQQIKYVDKRATAVAHNPWKKKEEANFDLMTTKSKDWEREQEYRIFYFLSKIKSENIVIPKEASLSDVKYYDREILTNLSGIILGVKSEISEHAINAALQRIKKKHIADKLHNPLYIPVDDIKIIRAAYHPENFNYIVKQELIDIRHEDLINKHYHALLNANWMPTEVKDFIDSLIRDRDREIVIIDDEAAYSTHINAFEKDEEFIIVPTIHKGGVHSGKYALFEYNPLREYRYGYVCHISQDMLKQLYKHAEETAALIKKETTLSKEKKQ